MVSRLYENDRYDNKDIEYIFGNEIIEYDLKSAGYNILCYFDLIPDSMKRKLSKMDKHERQIQIGMLQKNNKEFANKLSNGFKEARKLFFEANELKDLDVLSIKKDAIFTFRYCKYREFGNLVFDIKNKYTSYLYLNKFQFLYNANKIDIKGISDEFIEMHNAGMLLFLNDLFRYKESMTNDYITKFILDFAKDYKEKELPIEFYRELNKNSLYKTNMVFNNHDIYVTDTLDMDIIDISYNYMNYIIPLMRLQL